MSTVSNPQRSGSVRLLAVATIVAAGAVLAGSSVSGTAATVGAVQASAGNLDVYSSLPLHGNSQMLAMVNGIRLALAQVGGVAGQFTVKYTSLDDSNRVTGGFDPSRTAASARTAAADPAAVYYIGEFDSESSQVSIPLLNQAGIGQVGFSTYVGLTTSDPGSATGDPARYYPTGSRTFLRLAPRDTLQAGALLKAMRGDGCTRVAIANDGGVYGLGLATALVRESARYKIKITNNTATPSFGAYVRMINKQHARCFVFAGGTSTGAVKLTKTIGTALPSVKLYGGDGICTRDFTSPARHGIPASIGRRFKCTTPTLRLTDYPGGRAFLSAYEAKYGPGVPDSYAIFGYEAMRLALDTIRALGPDANSRSAVLRALFQTQARPSVIGTYGFDHNGDISLTTYGLYKGGHNGAPTFVRSITP